MAGGKVFEIRGRDAEHFLQALVTNDLAGLATGLVYAALLTPQGKYLSDFFLCRRGDAILLDVAPAVADATVQQLLRYRLRADVSIAESPLRVATTTDPNEALPDPRHPALGFRRYGPGADGAAVPAAIRVAHCIPETAIELRPNDSYVLESGFERLHGVDFHKGCYVGQEVTARMKHKTALNKGLVTVQVEGVPPGVGAEISASDGKPVGRLFTCDGDRGIAYLRFERAGGPMHAGDAAISWDGTQPE